MKNFVELRNMTNEVLTIFEQKWREDVLVMVSKKKAVSYRDNAPSFKNKLPEILPGS